MPACPACGTEVAPPAVECPGCHLSVGLFDAVRAAVGVEATDPRYSAEVHDLLRAVDATGPASPPEVRGPAVPSYPLRFPAAAPPRIVEPEGPSPPALDGLPALPALPSGGTTGLHRQIEEYAALGRALGVDNADLLERERATITADDEPTLERIARELFVRLAAALAEEYESTVARRNGLAGLVGVGPEDAELSAVRAELLAGDLSGGQRRLALVREKIGRMEEEHATILILTAECDLLADTIRELGGDPGPALGPYEEGRRRVLEGERGPGETMLAHASVALWAVLYPRLASELRRCKDALLARQADGLDVRPGVQQLRELAQNLKHRNFAATIGNYRRLREFVTGLAPALPVPEAPVPEAPTPPAPAPP